MLSRDQIRDSKRPIARRRVTTTEIDNTPAIRPIKHDIPPKPSTFLDIKRRPRSKPKPVPAQPRQNKSKVLKRQGLKKMPAFTPRKTKRSIVRSFAISGSFVLLFGITLGIYFGQKSNHDANQTAAVMSATDTQATDPQEIEPTLGDLRSHQVDDDLPRYFKSKRLGIDSRVKEIDIVGTTVTVPENIFDVGWYKNGGKPGENGVTLIVGSVSGQSRNGVFGRIGSINAGDTISIEMGDGTTHDYLVKATKGYPKEKVNVEELSMSVEPGKEALNILAVANRFDVRSQRFEDSFAVFAVKE